MRWRTASEPRDRALRAHPPIAIVATHADAARSRPPSERVQAHPQRAGRLNDLDVSGSRETLRARRPARRGLRVEYRRRDTRPSASLTILAPRDVVDATGSSKSATACIRSKSGGRTFPTGADGSRRSASGSSRILSWAMACRAAASRIRVTGDNGHQTSDAGPRGSVKMQVRWWALQDSNL